MKALQDPSMHQIILDFCDESQSIIDGLEELLNQLEENPRQTHLFEKFGQLIDGIMGASKTLGLSDISLFCELCKIIGYKSSQVVYDKNLINIVVAILLDSLELQKEMIYKIKTGQEGSLKSTNIKTFASRLKWLSEKFKNIERSSCKIENNKVPEKDQRQLKVNKNHEIAQSSIDELLDSLGI